MRRPQKNDEVDPQNHHRVGGCNFSIRLRWWGSTGGGRLPAFTGCSMIQAPQIAALQAKRSSKPLAHIAAGACAQLRASCALFALSRTHTSRFAKCDQATG